MKTKMAMMNNKVIIYFFEMILFSAKRNALL